MKSEKPHTHQARMGLLQATIWENRTETGLAYHVAFSRVREDPGGTESDRFETADLLLLSKLIDRIHTWAADRMQADLDNASKGSPCGCAPKRASSSVPTQSPSKSYVP